MPKRAIFEKKNILITGGAGFIGSHLCDELVKTAKVICVDNFSTGDEKNIDHLLANPNFRFIRHDITEPLDLESFPELDEFRISFQGIQEIYHLACPTSPKRFSEQRQEILLANSYGVKNALDIAVKYNAKFLQVSSSVVYGPRRDGNPRIREDDPGIVDPVSDRSCYDEGKRYAETLVANYRLIHRLDTKIARLFRVYGPRMSLGEGHMLPDFIDAALDNKDLVIYGGDDFHSSFCYVADIVDGLVKLMSSSLFKPVNFGSDVDVPIAQIAQKIIDIIGSKSKIKFVGQLLFMTPLCLPDITQARLELGWIPVVTLDSGLRKTIADLRASKGLKTVQSIDL